MMLYPKETEGVLFTAYNSRTNVSVHMHTNKATPPYTNTHKPIAGNRACKVVKCLEDSLSM